MQEDINRRSVVIIIRGTRLTAKTLALAMKAALRGMNSARDSPGQMSFRQLAKGGALQSIELSDGNIEAFEPIARKYGVRFRLVRDRSADTPRWLVFFRTKEADQMTAAFGEFAKKTLKRKRKTPSVHEEIAKNREVSREPVRDKTREQERSEPEL
ncbi:MAG: PcfB family protein [Oscillospiraceae bacterium]|nr:PcfB family protein [Oscillospiraceae bacterium]